MIKLPHIFSSGALFLQNSSLDLHGIANKHCKITFVFKNSQQEIFKTETQSDNSGKFSFVFKTPIGSFDEYEFVLNDGEELKITNIVFGELWLCSGQSNMSLENCFMSGKDEMYDSLKEMNIRIYCQYHPNAEGPFPISPSDEERGEWITTSDISKLEIVSACGTSMVKMLYQNLKTLPCGFLNSSVGGSSIESWLPRNEAYANEKIKQGLIDKNAFVEDNDWNMHGANNYQIVSALYNNMTAAHIGIKLRGIFWYQGEGNVGNNYYTEAFKLYHRHLKSLFCDESQNKFMIISVLLYPWLYDAVSTNECKMGYLNNCFVTLSDEEPEEFANITVYDLKPIWAMGLGNHPIHPVHKYILGERLCELALTNCYGKKGLKNAVTYKNMKKHGNELILTFNTFSEKLYFKGDYIKGFYICGKNNLYVEANVKIISKNQISISHPFIEKPQNAAYQYSNMEMNGNVYCGTMPISPFATDKNSRIFIAPKPWIHTEVDRMWVQGRVDDNYKDSYYRPTFYPENGTTICRDDVFCKNFASIRVRSENNFASIYTLSESANTLDMYNYFGLQFALIGNFNTKIALEFIYSENEFTKVSKIFKATKIKELTPDISIFEVKFDLDNCFVCEKLKFNFDFSELSVKTVAIEDIILMPKETKILNY